MLHALFLIHFLQNGGVYEFTTFLRQAVFILREGSLCASKVLIRPLKVKTLASRIQTLSAIV